MTEEELGLQRQYELIEGQDRQLFQIVTLGPLSSDPKTDKRSFFFGLMWDFNFLILGLLPRRSEERRKIGKKTEF